MEASYYSKHDTFEEKHDTSGEKHDTFGVLHVCSDSLMKILQSKHEG